MKRRRESDDDQLPPTQVPFYDKEKLMAETAFTTIAYNRQFGIPTGDYTLLLYAKTLSTSEALAQFNKAIEHCMKYNQYCTLEEIKQRINE